MEFTRKIGQDKYFLKILTFWSTFVQKSTFGNWTFAQFLSFEWRNGSQNQNVLEKLSGTGPFWKFWLFGQGQGSTWSKHFFFLSPFFFFFFWGGSDRVRFPGRFGSNWVSLVKPGSGGWRHPWRHAQRERVSTWRVERVKARECSASARDGAWKDADDRRTFRWRVEVRDCASWPEIFRSCISKAAEDPCRVSCVKFWTGLHRFEGLCGGVSKDFGGAWQCVRPFLGLKFSGFVDRGPMDRVVASVL